MKCSFTHLKNSLGQFPDHTGSQRWLTSKWEIISLSALCTHAENSVHIIVSSVGLVVELFSSSTDTISRKLSADWLEYRTTSTNMAFRDLFLSLFSGGEAPEQATSTHHDGPNPLEPTMMDPSLMFHVDMLANTKL